MAQIQKILRLKLQVGRKSAVKSQGLEEKISSPFLFLKRIFLLQIFYYGFIIHKLKGRDKNAGKNWNNDDADFTL